jgi:outer membrane protein TolC
VRPAVLAEVKASFFQLANLSKTLAILESDGELLKQIEQAADTRYRSGTGKSHFQKVLNMMRGFCRM